MALTCRAVGEILERAPGSSWPWEESVTGVHSPFACAKDLVGVGMAKALLGQRVYQNDRLVGESARLRMRVRDLEGMIQDLQLDNDRLRASRRAEIKASRQPV